MRLFIYGILRHQPLLSVVIDREIQAAERRPARIDEASIAFASDTNLLMIDQEAGGQVEGFLLSGLTDHEQARLDFFNHCSGYQARDMITDQGVAQTYVAPQQMGPQGPEFDLAAWVSAWGVHAVETAREVMKYFGQRPASDVAPMLSAIRKRAWARVIALGAPGPEETFRGAVTLDHRQIRYADFFAMEEFALRVEQFDGSVSPELRRAVFLAMDAAIVLPYDPVRDRVLLVEQFRMGPLARQDADMWQLEPVAGHIDPGETPAEAARREAEEEAGLTIRDLIPVAEGYPSPGASSEFYHIYVGLSDLPDRQAQTGGLAEEGEDIRTHLLDFDALMHMVETRRARNVPLVLAAYWLAHNRERLRQPGPGASPRTPGV